ncbi:MAG: hypothetical protein GY880_31370 [Planctomycetaceae bacterium]|nr:hypothetical protein [Planctomycetaceae bacterium]MCP4778739.1 hypothetical protein [Planctomycetaceae bacterium]
MRVMQQVTATYKSCYTSWSCFTITDTKGDRIEIELTDDQYLEMERSIVNKCDAIRKDRMEKAREANEESISNE